VRREARFTDTDVKELREWFGRESRISSSSASRAQGGDPALTIPAGMAPLWKSVTRFPQCVSITPLWSLIKLIPSGSANQKLRFYKDSGGCEKNPEL
jgi:hypothetical protein